MDIETWKVTHHPIGSGLPLKNGTVEGHWRQEIFTSYCMLLYHAHFLNMYVLAKGFQHDC